MIHPPCASSKITAPAVRAVSHAPRKLTENSSSQSADFNVPVQGADLRYDLRISFMDAVHGIDRDIEIARRETCWTCEGTGGVPLSNQAAGERQDITL